MLFFGLFKKKKKEVIEPTPPTKQTTVIDETQEVMMEDTVNDEPITEKPQKERKMSYHITKHPNGGWQLKKGKASRALKLFDTQKEAIDYAKQLEKERGISFIIHKADGSTRKKTY